MYLFGPRQFSENVLKVKQNCYSVDEAHLSILCFFQTKLKWTVFYISTILSSKTLKQFFLKESIWQQGARAWLASADSTGYIDRE